MDYAKSGDQEIGTVIECHKWVEGSEIRYWRSEIRVGTGSNKHPLTTPNKHRIDDKTFTQWLRDNASLTPGLVEAIVKPYICCFMCIKLQHRHHLERSGQAVPRKVKTTLNSHKKDCGSTSQASTKLA